MEPKQLKRTADLLRLDILEMVYRSKSGHIGGSLSCIDVLTCLYLDVMDTEKIKRKDPDRDRFILSKGHCAESLYAILARAGFYDKRLLETYAQFGTALAEHPTSKVPGVEVSTGALGHGLSIGVGLGIALMRDQLPAHVYVLLGDGEMDEGSNWEAAMSASKYGLSNLTAIVDRNCLQISGDTEQVMPLGDVALKLSSFGWHTVAVDGHDHAALCHALREKDPSRPTAVVMQTAKGKGVSFMENSYPWHHQIPNAEEYEQAKRELTARLEEQND